MAENKKMDSCGSLGLHTKTPIKQGEGGAKGNDSPSGNQRPVASVTSLGGGKKIK